MLELDFISNEMDDYPEHKETLEQKLHDGLITFDDYIRQLEILNYDYQNLKKYKQKNE